MRARLIAIATAVAIAGMLGFASAASATPSFKPYEVTAVWQMASVPAGMPLNTPEPNGPFTWPQTRLSDIPSPECGPPIPIQFDKYTIKSKADATYFANLTTMTSSSDDQRLSPHDYYAEVIGKSESDCAPPTTSTPPPPPSTTPPPPPSSSTTTTTAPPPSTSSSSTSPSTHTTTSTHSQTTSTSAHTSPSSSLAPPISVHSTPAAHVRKLANTGADTGFMIVVGVIAVILGVGCIGLGWGGTRRSH